MKKNFKEIMILEKGYGDYINKHGGNYSFGKNGRNPNITKKHFVIVGKTYGNEDLLISIGTSKKDNPPKPLNTFTNKKTDKNENLYSDINPIQINLDHVVIQTSIKYKETQFSYLEFYANYSNKQLKKIDIRLNEASKLDIKGIKEYRKIIKQEDITH